MNGVYINAGSNNTVQGNRIGSTAAGDAGIPNGYAGVYIRASTNNIVGGTATGAPNLIAYNAGPGVVVTGTGGGNAVLANSIFGNGGLGIDLGDNGVTVNDGTRSANLPNTDIDVPVFTAASLSGGTLTVAGYVGSAPSQSTFGGCRIELFKADNDASGYGEAPTFLGALTADANGNFSGTLTGVALAATDKISATATDAANNTSELAGNVFVVNAIAGTVFEDVSYGGGAGRDRTTAVGAPVAGARVELFSGSGAFLGATTTDPSGAYAFSALTIGAYTVRVVNASVASTRGGATSGLGPVQTYRTDAGSGSAIPVIDHVGGEVPGKTDAGNASSTLSALSNSTTTPQSIATVMLGSTAVTGVDFGYSFNVIVNRNDAGQGTIRQFLINANALTNAGLAQAGRTAGIDHAVFMLADGTARPGLNAGYPSMLSSGHFAVALASPLPSVIDPVVLDGTTLSQWVSTPLIDLNGSNAGAARSCDLGRWLHGARTHHRSLPGTRHIDHRPGRQSDRGQLHRHRSERNGRPRQWGKRDRHPGFARERDRRTGRA